MNTAGALLFWPLIAAYFFSQLTVLFYAVGVVWAIPAAFICARIAKGKNLEGRSHAIRGGLYSALNFWMWFYYMTRMQGKDISDLLISVFFIVLFVSWLFVSVYLSFITNMISFWASDTTFRYPEYKQEIIVRMWVIGSSGAVSAIAWIVSLASLLKAKYGYQVPDHNKQAAQPQLRTVYLIPCVFAPLFSVIPFAVFTIIQNAIE